MKKQFITGVLLLAATAFGLSTFTSCKDTDEDLYNQLNSEQVSLRAQLAALQLQLSQCPANCKQKVDSLETELMKLINAKADTTDVNGKADTADVNAKYRKLDSLYKALEAKLADYLKASALADSLQSIYDRLDSLEKRQPGTITTPGTTEYVYQFTTADSALIKRIIVYTAEVEDFFKTNGGYDALKDTLGNVQGSITTINSSIAGIKETLYGTDGNGGLVKTVEGLSEWFEGLGLTPQQFQENVKAGAYIVDNKAALDSLVKYQNSGLFDAAALDALNKSYADFSKIGEMYTTLFGEGEAPEGGWWNLASIQQKITENAQEIANIKNDIEKMVNRLNDMVTSLILQATNNSVFGGFNTPFGINSMVLMTVYGELSTNIRQFPDSEVGAECYSVENDDIDWASLVADRYDLNARETKKIVALNKNKQASLGNLWFTVNPGTVNNLDVNGFAIVNSVENDVVKVVNVTKDDETVLKFGVGSRAAGNGNGLYKAEAAIDPENLDQIKVHIESGLAQSLKDAVKNRTASDMVQMFKAIYNQLQDVCDANALRYTYKAATGKDAQGNWIETDQKVYSNYGMAATAFKPLSYATLKGTSIRHLPTFGSIELPKDLVDLDLGTFEVDSKNFNLSLNFGEPVFTPVGTVIVGTHVTLTAEDGQEVSGDIEINITEQAQEIQDNVTNAISEWLGADGGIDARVEKAIWYALFNDPNAVDPKYPYDPSQSVGVVASLVSQVNDMMGSIQDKLDSLMDKINKDYLGKVNSLISKYNTVAERINNVLDDPNHYLQSVMLYRKAGKLALNGTTPEVELPFGILSTDPKQPTQFKGAGEAISLWATSYTFETVAPAFKKCVAVVSVKEGKADGTVVERNDLVQEANETLAKVMNGDQTRVALNVKNAKGGVFTYEVAFQALDYTGHTSTVKCYLQVVR